jgi:hypothetical protein
MLCYHTCFTLIYCLVFYSFLKVEATYSSETSVVFQMTTLQYMPEDEVLKSKI